MSANETVRQIRLQSLKEAIAAGTYRVDTRLVANSLLVNLFQEQWERIKKQQ